MFYNFNKVYSINKSIKYTVFLDSYRIYKNYNNYGSYFNYENFKKYKKYYTQNFYKTYFDKYTDYLKNYKKNNYSYSKYSTLNKNSYSQNVFFKQTLRKLFFKHFENFKSSIYKHNFLTLNEYFNKVFISSFIKSYDILNYEKFIHSYKSNLKKSDFINLNISKLSVSLQNLNKGFSHSKALLFNTYLKKINFLEKKYSLELYLFKRKFRKFYFEMFNNSFISKFKSFSKEKRIMDIYNVFKKENFKSYFEVEKRNFFMYFKNTQFFERFKTESFRGVLSFLQTKFYLPKKESLKYFKKIDLSYNESLQKNSFNSKDSYYENQFLPSYLNNEFNHYFNDTNLNNNSNFNIDYEDIFSKIKEFIYEEISNFCDGIY